MRIRFIESIGHRGFLELRRSSTAKFCVALKGSPFWFDDAEVGVEVFPTYARKFYAWEGLQRANSCKGARIRFTTYAMHQQMVDVPRKPCFALLHCDRTAAQLQ